MNTDKAPYFPDDEMEIRLWEYIDGLSEAADKTAIEKLIAENAAWRNKYNELLALNTLLQSTELEQPSLRFTKNVMEEISRAHIAPATKEYINKKIIWGIVAFFVAVITGFLVYGISQVNWQAKSTANPAGIDFSKVDYSPVFSNSFINIFMMINIILGLMLLDRYLSARRKTWHKDAG